MSDERITTDELAFIRQLSDFGLMMLLEEINDHGWPVAKKLLALIAKTLPAETGSRVQ